MRRWFVGLFILCAVLRSGAVRGQPLPDINTDRGAVSRSYGWIEWWETNRDTYLRKALKNEETSKPPRQVVAKVVAELLRATYDGPSNLQAEAALALARMGQGKERLIELTKDHRQNVRRRAWVGLGLLGDEDDLLQATTSGEGDSIAVMIGLGLLDKPSPKALLRVRSAARSIQSASLARVAIWALRAYHRDKSIDEKKPGGDDNSILLSVLENSTNPALVSEALVAMGTIDGWQNLPLLIDVARLDQQALALPAFALESKKTKKNDLRVATNDTLNIRLMRAAACLAMSEFGSEGKGPGNGATNNGGNIDQIMTTAENALTRNAGLGPHGEKIAQDGDIVMGTITNVFPEISVLGLSRFGKPQTLALILANMEWGPQPSNSFAGEPMMMWRYGNTDYPFRPHRGYAAIAIALSGRNTDQLRTCARDFGQPYFLRTACLLALGMTGDKANADVIAQVADRLSPKGDALMCGYAILGLGLLHDERALGYAFSWGISRSNSINLNPNLVLDFEKSIQLAPVQGSVLPGEMDVLLGLRAAMLGLAVLGDRRAEPIFLANWGSEQWISLEAARGMGWCGAYDGVNALLTLMDQTERQNVRVWAARSLGEMFDQSRPSKLSRLVEGNCYVTPPTFECEYQSLESGLLYLEILPGHLPPT